MPARGITRKPSSSSASPSQWRNKADREEKHGRKAKKSLDDEKARPQSKWQTRRREISCRTRATRDLYQSSTPSSITDDYLGLEAKMAKERLEKRLRPPLKAQTNREIRLQKDQVIQWKEAIFGQPRFNWIPMTHKTFEQEDCGVCLEELSDGLSLDRLPCGHKFHSYCLRQWLPINPNCPNCRTTTVP